MPTLPVIDISPLYTHDHSKEAYRAVAHEIEQACCTWGFFYIVGHPIKKERIEELKAMANKFFSLPMEEKLKIDITQSKNHRGYNTPAAEQLDAGNTRDWKEMFDMGCHLPLDHPSVKAGEPLRGPNRHPDIPGWAELMETHYKDMMQLALTVLRAIAIAIGAPENFFDDKCHEPLSGFRIIHYPQLPPEEKGRVVCGSHTDYGLITLLYQDNVGGLQVRNLQGEWIDATPVEGSFVVNIGDMMAMWSNDRFKSNFHRVVHPGVERYSMPFFTEPNPNIIVSCLPNCYNETTNPKRYPDVKAVDWLQKRFAETYDFPRSKI